MIRPDHQLHPQDQQDRDVGAVAGVADARVEHAAVDQHRQADEAEHAGNAARPDRHALLGRRAHEGPYTAVRRQQADQVAEEQEQDADVEQVAAPAQQAGAQQLRRVALPGVLVAVEADQAAEQEHRQADVRIDLEQKAVRASAHARTPWLGRACGWRTMWMGCGWPGRAWPLDEQPSKTDRLVPAVVDRLVGGQLAPAAPSRRPVRARRRARWRRRCRAAAARRRSH